MFRKVVGDENFFKIYDAYLSLRVSSGEPISTECFQKIAEEKYGKPLDWFFKQWVGYTETTVTNIGRKEAQKIKKLSSLFIYFLPFEPFRG